MSDQELSMDDRELFEAATEQEAPEPKAAEPARDEQGRFAPKEEAEAKPAEATKVKPEVQADKPIETEDDKSGQVPSWRLREVREAREAAERREQETSRTNQGLQSRLQAMERELSQLKAPKQEPVDFFADPDKAFSQKLTPIEERFAKLEGDMRLNTSRAMAIATHGAQAVSEMEKAVEKAMADNNPDVFPLAAQMRSSADPVSVAMKWHQRSKLWDTTGGDPEAYRQKILDEAMKDPAFQAKAIEAARGQSTTTPGTRPNIQLPPSLNRASGSGTSTAVADDNDYSDRALFDHATR